MRIVNIGQINPKSFFHFYVCVCVCVCVHVCVWVCGCVCVWVCGWGVCGCEGVCVCACVRACGRARVYVRAITFEPFTTAKVRKYSYGIKMTLNHYFSK